MKDGKKITKFKNWIDKVLDRRTKEYKKWRWNCLVASEQSIFNEKQLQ